MGEKRRLYDDLAQRGSFSARFDDSADVVFDRAIVYRLECADIDHHVDFVGAVEYRATGLVGFDVRTIGAKRKSGDGADADARSAKKLGGEPHPGWLNTYRRESMLRRFGAELSDLLFGGVGFEKRVVDESGEASMRSGSREAETFRAALDERLHHVGTLVAIEMMTAARAIGGAELQEHRFGHRVGETF